METVDLTTVSSQFTKKKSKLTDWISSSFESTPSKSEDSSTVTRKRKFSKHSSTEFDKQNIGDTWLERYAPVTLEDLAVHKKKIAEVDSWLSQNVTAKKDGAPILLITGPPGCGKTTTLILVARKHSMDVEEWSNPLTTPFSVTKQAGLKYESQKTKFEEFLFRSGKYKSVLMNLNEKQHVDKSNNKVILLEELPNYIYQDPPIMIDLFKRYQRTQRWPLVLIMSDEASSDPLRREIRNMKNRIATISFNPISATLMSKVLLRIASCQNRTLSKEELGIMTSLGDIRAAINGMQFSSQCETLKDSCKRPKKCANKTITSCHGGKDTTLILFRAIGKIFYPKRKKDENIECVSSQYRHRDPLIIQPEEVLDQCCLSGNAFSFFLHHNYLNFFDNNPIEDITTAAEYLSFSDLINSPLTSSDPSSGALAYLDRYEGIVASRGMIFANSSRATSELCAKTSGSWRPMHKPSWYQVRRQEQENRIASHRLFWKQEDALPCLVPLASKFDYSRKCFLREVIALPKWKAFRSHEDRLTEHDVGNDIPEISDEKCNSDVSESQLVNDDDDDDDITIEEFSD